MGSGWLTGSISDGHNGNEGLPQVDGSVIEVSEPQELPLRIDLGNGPCRGQSEQVAIISEPLNVILEVAR